MSKTKHTPKEIGLYLVYPNGCIESTLVHGQWKNARTIQPIDNGDGYLFVRLTINGKRKKWMLHNLMATLFLGPKPGRAFQVRHLDGNPKNNRIENLAWGTAKENAQDREKHGRTSKGTRHTLAIKKAIERNKISDQLIAAAPEMLEALHAAERCLAVAIHAGAFQDCAAPNVGKAALAMVSNAIAKATGGAE